VKRSAFLTAAMAAALVRPAMADDLTISSATTASVSTSTAANGTPGNITIAPGGSIASVGNVAVTLDSNNSVVNNGLITNTGSLTSVGVNILAGHTGSFTNTGNITVLGTGNTTVSSFGVELSGNGAFTGNILLGNTSVIAVTTTNAQGLGLVSDLTGNVTVGGSITATGQDAKGVLIRSSMTGSFTNRGIVTVSGGGTSTTVINPAPGSAIGVGGSIHGGFLNAGPINGSDTTPAASINGTSTAPALFIAPTVAGDVGAQSIGILQDATDPGFSIINRGRITSSGDQPSISTVGMQIGNSAGNIALQSVLDGGILNAGTISASATSSNANATAALPTVSNATAVIIGSSAVVPQIVNTASGNITATTGGPIGGTATAITILSNASLPQLTNAGLISANAGATTTSIGTLIAQGIVDSSGTLLNITNSGTIAATATVLDTNTQIATAINLGVTSLAQTVTNSGTITGDIIFGGSPNSQLIIEGPHAIMTGAVKTTSAGRVNIAVSQGGTGGTLVTNGAIRAGTLTVGANGTLNIGIGTTNGITASGAATFDPASHLIVTPLTLLPSDSTITLIHSNTSLTFGDFAATTAGLQIPFLFTGSLTHNANDLTLALHRKTAGELGLTGNAAIIYEPAMKAATNDIPVGAAFSSLGSSSAIQASLVQMLPVVNNAQRVIADSATNSTTDTLALRQRTLALAPEVEGGTSLWVEGIYRRFDDTGAIPFSGDGEGATAGVDYTDPAKGHFGIAFTYFKANADENAGRIASTDSQWYLLSPYMGMRRGNFFINAQLNAGFGRLNYARTVEVGPVLRSTTVNVTQWLASGGITSGYAIDLGAIRIVPQININALDVGTNNYTELNGGTGVDLAVQKSSQTSLRALAGAAAGGSYELYGGHLVPQVFGGYSYEMLNTSTTANARFASVSGTDFTILGPGDDRSQIVGSGSIAYVSNSWTVGVSFDEAFQSDAQVQSAKFTVAGRF
jgi:autotransporter-like protein